MRRTFALLAIAPLAGCAGHTIPSPAAQTSSLNGQLNTGTVVAVRNVEVDHDNGAVRSVLAALGQTPSEASNGAVEVIIRRQDNTITSVVQPQHARQPDFEPGDKVAIVEAAATILRPQ